MSYNCATCRKELTKSEYLNCFNTNEIEIDIFKDNLTIEITDDNYLKMTVEGRHYSTTRSSVAFELRTKEIAVKSLNDIASFFLEQAKRLEEEMEDPDEL